MNQTLQAASAEPAPEPRRRPSERSHRATFLAIAMAGLLLVVASIAAGLAHRSTGTTWEGTLDTPPFHKPEFVLTDDTGHRYDFGQRTEGQLTLLYFGYTHCPDVCPITMETLAGALSGLPDQAVTVVFVTTDPARDTPTVIHRWLGDINPNFVGLTGTPAQLKAAQQAAGVSIAIPDKPDRNGNYTVGHAASVLAYTPDGLQHLSYPYPETQADWVHDIPQILSVKAWQETP